MKRYDPDRMELSTRDRVALAAYTEIKAGRGTPRGGVCWTSSHLPRTQIMERLPRVYQTLMDLQLLDITTTPIEIAPTAHYSMAACGFGQKITAPVSKVSTRSAKPRAGCTEPIVSAALSDRTAGLRQRSWVERQPLIRRGLNAQQRCPAAVSAARDEIDGVFGHRWSPRTSDSSNARCATR